MIAWTPFELSTDFLVISIYLFYDYYESLVTMVMKDPATAQVI